MKNKEIIKPCPLCGGAAMLKDARGAQVRQGWVGCPACGLRIQWKVSPGGAVKKWNRRAPPRVETALFDQAETFPDCTVQVRTNTITGEQSFGWWPNEPGGES